MESLNNLVLDLGGYAWNLVIILAVFLALFYGFKSRFLQRKLFPESLRIFWTRRNLKSADGVTGAEAFWITLGGCIGTGNVAGVAMAIVVGGPGAVFWMWLIAIGGMLTSFLENTLAQLYKVKEGPIFRGGPAYYMARGLKNKHLGTLYAFFMIVSLGFALAALQNNTITLSMNYSLNIPVVATSAVVTAINALIIFGGIKRIAQTAEKFVPIMTAIYFILTIFVIVVRREYIGEAVRLIFTEAFNFRSLGGGIIGSMIYQGIKRGVFSNGAGQGDAPTVGASSNVSHPAEQGIFGSFAVFVDTMIVCTLTAIVIILSQTYIHNELVGIELAQSAFASVLGHWASIVIAFCIFLFCFTSIMSNYICGETSLTYLTGGIKGRNAYKIIFTTAIFLGGILSVDIMWNIADLFCAILVCLNMISLVFLGNRALILAKDYFEQRKNGIDAPTFNSKGTSLEENTECWHQ